MKFSIKFNDAWEMTWSEAIDGFREFFEQRLQPSHPLREYDLYPLAKVERKYKFLVEEMESSDKLWVQDFEKKKRVKGKTCYYFKLIVSQEKLIAIEAIWDDLLASAEQVDSPLWHQEALKQSKAPNLGASPNETYEQTQQFNAA